MKPFSDLNNKYALLDYVPTHSQLLIRSMRNRKRDYNIDIIFKPISALNIPQFFEGMELTVLSSQEGKRLIGEKYQFEIKKDYSVFLLQDGKKNNYFVIAMAVGVFHNKMDILETSIGPFRQASDWGTKVFWYYD
jgi:hypothetical protein